LEETANAREFTRITEQLQMDPPPLRYGATGSRYTQILKNDPQITQISQITHGLGYVW
jgi:hypothetical protein